MTAGWSLSTPVALTLVAADSEHPSLTIRCNYRPEEWEEAALLYGTRNMIRLGTATRRQRCGLPPVLGG